MSTSRRLQRNRATADLASVTDVLSRIDPNDYFGRVSLQGRQQDLEEEVAREGAAPDETTASAALFFAGSPVIGTTGIESGFAGIAVSRFQDLVAKLAIEQRGDLSQRGPLPAHDEAKLHITGVLRGSFGFMLEELSPAASMFDTPLKSAVGRATHLLEAFTDASEEAFDTALEDTDPRSIAAARDFFSHLASSGATLRLETEQVSVEFSHPAIERASARALSSSIDEEPGELRGILAGLLPHPHMFDLEIRDGEVAVGRISKDITSEQISEWLQTLLGREVVAQVTVRTVSRDGAPPRKSYLLHSIRLEIQPGGGQAALQSD